MASADGTPAPVRPPAPPLFQPITLRSVTLPNRMVVAPMCQYMANDGCATTWHEIHLGTFACGGFGLVTAEATAVLPDGRITPHCLGIWGDAQEAALHEVISRVRQVAATPLGIQIAHAGRKSGFHRPFVGEPKGPVDSATTETSATSSGPRGAPPAWPRVAPSAHAFGTGPVPRELSIAELSEITRAFATAAERAVRIGFDYLEVHAAHGYLLASFLSPVSNTRQDDYGGSLERRMRFPLEVVERVRSVWPHDRPLGVRFGGSDWIDDGWSIDDACAFALELEARGVDILSVSTAGNAPVQPSTGPGWLVPHAGAVRRALHERHPATNCAVTAVGELDDPVLAAAIVASGSADLVALARGALRDPRFPWRAARALGQLPQCVAPYAWAVGR